MVGKVRVFVTTKRIYENVYEKNVRCGKCKRALVTYYEGVGDRAVEYSRRFMEHEGCNHFSIIKVKDRVKECCPEDFKKLMELAVWHTEFLADIYLIIPATKVDECLEILDEIRWCA